ncbi:hypothetical protein QZH41_012008 [Actinostola sp. cb2023]|nr:hypothetical protein QZH41_012008 [Actinostola sp. cb2023]
MSKTCIISNYFPIMNFQAGLGHSTILVNYGNSTYFKTLSEFLKPVLSSNNGYWIRCWHGATHGWAGTTFQELCSQKVPTVVIVRVGSYVFGGYTNSTWDGGISGYRSAPKSFLYSLYNTRGYSPFKLVLLNPSTNLAIYTSIGLGPAFGAGQDLLITDRASTSTTSSTRPNTYQVPEGCTHNIHCTVYAGVSPFTVSDIEVFYET